MAPFIPFDQTTQLPPPGAVESYVLDFKGALNLGHGGKVDHVELAKDVAAFANADGGALLIGAFEDATRGVLGRYKPLNDAETKLFRESYSRAVRDYCSPPPIVDSVPIPQATGSIVAVNVWPFPGQAVGVRSREHVDAYFFPIRTGIDTNFLTAEQLPMVMSADIRRKVILIRGMKTADPIAVRIKTRNGNEDQVRYFDSVDELSNAVVFTSRPPSENHTRYSYPLEQIQAVWRDDSKGWQMLIDYWS